MKAKKSLGQHFLKSEKALMTIIETGNLKVGETVLEIGPGRGVLTRKLLETGAKVIAVEKDDELLEFLKQEFKKEIESGKLELIHEDILNFQTSNLKTYKLIANIPYNITGAILKKFLEADHQPEKIVLLVQKEVGKRMIGILLTPSVNRGKESMLSISVKAYGTPRYIETVKAGSFAPMPKVDSAIIAIENISKTFFQKIAGDVDVDTECQRVERRFFEVVRAGFKTKRKKLSSNLSAIADVDTECQRFGKKQVLDAFKKLGLDENLRAEETNIETWKKLVELLGKL